MIRKILAFRINRFILVGTINTIVNFSLLNLSFFVLNQSKIVSGFIATFFAMLFSFVLNRSFVFLDKKKPAKKFIYFLIVTITGSLVIHNLVYIFGVNVLSRVVNEHLHIAGSDFAAINLSNLLAAPVVVLWNYNGYRVFVFRGSRQGDIVIEDEQDN